MTLPADLEALDAYLLSDMAPEHCLLLSDLDGYLTAVALCPEPIPRDTWYRMIWGEEEPRFASAAEEQAIADTIEARFARISAHLADYDEAIEPIFDADQEGHVSATDWAEGFLDGMAVSAEAWNPLIDHPEAFVLLTPIMLLGDFDPEEDDELEVDMEKLMEEAPNVLPLTVVGIHEFWREYLAAQKPARKRAPRKATPSRRKGA